MKRRSLSHRDYRRSFHSKQSRDYLVSLHCTYHSGSRSLISPTFLSIHFKGRIAYEQPYNKQHSLRNELVIFAILRSRFNKKWNKSFRIAIPPCLFLFLSSFLSAASFFSSFLRQKSKQENEEKKVPRSGNKQVVVSNRSSYPRELP